MYLARPVIVQVGEGDLVLRPDRAPDDELVDVIELVPVLWEKGETTESGPCLGIQGQLLRHPFPSPHPHPWPRTSSLVSMSRNRGSNLGPPGMHMLSDLAVTKACGSNR